MFTENTRNSYRKLLALECSGCEKSFQTRTGLSNHLRVCGHRSRSASTSTSQVLQSPSCLLRDMDVSSDTDVEHQSDTETPPPPQLNISTRKVETGENAYEDRSSPPLLSPAGASSTAETRTEIFEASSFINSLIELRSSYKDGIRDPQHVCKICSRSCLSKRGLELHESVHSDAQSHPCNLCDKSFKVKSSLVRHVRAFHSHQRPYSPRQNFRKMTSFSGQLPDNLENTFTQIQRNNQETDAVVAQSSLIANDITLSAPVVGNSSNELSTTNDEQSNVVSVSPNCLDSEKPSTSHSNEKIGTDNKPKHILPNCTIISSDGISFKCHKSILAANSATLKTLFFGEHKDRPETDTLTMDEIHGESVEAFLEYLYTYKVEVAKDNPKVAVELLKLGHKYGITSLEDSMKNLILKWMENWEHGVDAALQLFMTAKISPDLHILKRSALEIIIAKGRAELMNSETFKNLFQNDSSTAMELCGSFCDMAMYYNDLSMEVSINEESLTRPS